MIARIISPLIIRLIKLKNHRKIEFGKKVRVFPMPYIIVRKNCKVIIGNNVTLNSANSGYHLNMHSKIKIMADRLGAKIRIGDNCRIHGACIHAYKSISIGANCLIAANCQIFDGNGHDLSFSDVANRINTKGGAKEVVIQDNVWLGANVIVMPGVLIGKGSVISAGSVVCDDIPPMCLARGNPAQVIRSYEESNG